MRAVLQKQVQELATRDAERLVFATLASTAATRSAALVWTALRFEAQLWYGRLQDLQATPRVFVLGKALYYLHAFQYVDNVVDPPPFNTKLFRCCIQTYIRVTGRRVQRHETAYGISIRVLWV